METTSPTEAQDTVGEPPVPGGREPRRVGVPGRIAVDAYARAAFPWYGLDEAFTGRRWLMQVASGSDGVVHHGSMGHGDVPSIRSDAESPRERFAVVITVAASPVRRSADGTGVLEATTVSSAAWLASSGLLAHTWPPHLDHGLRDDWLAQQTEAAFDLADDMSGVEWSTLTLPVDGEPTPFHYRESEFGWVLAGTTAAGVYVGAYGRGMSAYGLGFSAVPDLAPYL
ncbi:hypothetical protein ACFVIM_35100 [Streptomyces sp. NPDC057638]|uniref:hypothetical protein n=1 Tax=Streptomyces sp. NPDC057638 TaxID=3346190 RepID=UPI0036CD9C82